MTLKRTLWLWLAMLSYGSLGQYVGGNGGGSQTVTQSGSVCNPLSAVYVQGFYGGSGGGSGVNTLVGSACNPLSNVYVQGFYGGTGGGSGVSTLVGSACNPLSNVYVQGFYGGDGGGAGVGTLVGSACNPLSAVYVQAFRGGNGGGAGVGTLVGSACNPLSNVFVDAFRGGSGGGAVANSALGDGSNGGTILGNQILCSAGTALGFSEAGCSSQSGTYQWESSTTSESTGFSNISGATANTYTPSGVISQTTWYRRKVTFTLNSIVYNLYSNVVKVEVFPTTITIQSSPAVTTLYGPNESVTLTAVATGAIEPTYQWFKNSVAIPNATAATFNVTYTNSGSYTVQVTKGSCTGTSAATVITVSTNSEATTAGIPATNIKLWFKADGTLTKDANNRVSQWNDASVLGSNITQNVSGSQPLWVDKAIGTKPAIEFNNTGGNKFLNNTLTNPISAGVAKTVFVVGKMKTDGTVISALTLRRGTTLASYSFGSSSSPYIYSDGVNTSNNASITGSDADQIKCPTFFTYQNSGVNQPLSFWINGTQVGVSQGGGVAAETGTTGFTVGGREDGYYTDKGFIAEIIAYDRALTPTERQQVETYLQNKYADATLVADINGGTIDYFTASYGTCGTSAFDPQAFKEVLPAKGKGVGSCAYQWQISLNGTTFTDIAGANAPLYDPTTVSFTTWFRRKVTINSIAYFSNTLEISIVPLPTITRTGTVPLCNPGSTATLTANNLPTDLTGYTIQWLKNGLEILGANSATLVVSSADVSPAGNNFTVRLSKGSCSQTSAVNTISSSVQNPTISSNVYDICGAGQVNLTAANCTGTINWYDVPTGGTLLATGTTYSPILNQTRSFYAECVSSNSCASGRPFVNIIVRNQNNSGASFVYNGQTCQNISSVTPTYTPLGGSFSMVQYTPGVSVNASNGVVSSNQAGTFAVRYTLPAVGTCPVSSVTTNVIFRPLTDAPTISASAVQVTSGTPVTLTASGCAGTINWSNGSTGSIIVISPTSTLNYWATCTDNFNTSPSYNCASVRSNEINVAVGTPPPPTGPTISSNFNNVCAGTIITLSATGCTTGVVNWSNGGSGNQINVQPLTSASYTATCTVGTTVSANSSPLNLTINPKPQPTVSPSPAYACVNSDAILQANTGSGLTYQWYKGSTLMAGQTSSSLTVSHLNLDQYAVEETLNGCTNLSPYVDVIRNPSVPATVTASGALTFCTGASVTLTANLNATYNYEWYRNGTLVGGSSGLNGGHIYTATTTGTYTVKVIAATCSSISDPIYVTVNPLPTATITAGGPTQICTGTGSVSLTANTGTGLAYSWTRTNNSIVTNVGTTQTISATQTGEYKVTTTDQFSGCQTTSLGTIVNIDSAPTAATIATSSSTTFCQGTSIILNATSSNSGTLTYQWYKDGVLIPLATNTALSVNSAGTFTVKITRNGCESVASNGITTTLTSGPAVSISPSGSVTVCNGTGSVALTATSANAITYQWRVGNADISGQITANYTATATGNYSVTVTDAQGCQTTSIATTVNIVNPPAAAITYSGSTTFCANQSLTLNANSGSGLSYEWKKNGVALPFGYTSSYNATETGNYTVTVTKDGCSVTSTGVVITVNPLPTATVTAAGPTDICAGTGSVVLNANTGANLTYIWKKDNVVIPSETANSYTATTSGTYTVQVTETVNNCASTSAGGVVIQIRPTPAAPNVTAATSPIICAGLNVRLDAASSETGTLYYQWYKDGNAIAYANSASYYAFENGTFTCKITRDGCTSIASNGLLVTVQALPQSIVTANGPTQFCGGSGSVQLTANVGSGFTYKWLKNSVEIPSQTASTYTATESGVFRVEVTDSYGCKQISPTGITVQVTPSPLAVIAANGNAKICQGQLVELIANSESGFTYAWQKDGVTIPCACTFGNTWSATQSGSYRIIITKNGCSTTSSPILVDVKTLPTITASGSTSFCVGGNVVLNAVPATATSYQWNFSNAPISGAISTSYPANQAGLYSVTATVDNVACTSAQTTVTTIPKPAAPTISYQVVGVNNVLTASGCTGTGLVTWSTGVTGASITVNPSTAVTYSATCTDNGCLSDPSNAITIGGYSSNQNDTISDISICAGSSAVLNVTPCTGGTISWASTPTGASGSNPSLTVSPTVQTMYQATCTQGAIVTYSNPMRVSINSLPATPVITAGNTTICDFESTTLSVSGCNGQVIWSTGDVGASLIVKPTLTTAYSAVCRSSSNSCNSNVSASFTVTVLPSTPTPVIAATQTVINPGQSVTLSAAGTCAGTFTWSNGQTGNSITVSPNSSTSYRVRCGGTGCSDWSNFLTILVGNVGTPVPQVSASGLSICPGQSVSISASGCTGIVSWNTGQTGSPITVSPTATTDYTAICTVAGIPSLPSDPITVTVRPNPPIIGISANAPLENCTNSPITLTATNTTSGLTYQWFKDNNPVGGGTNASLVANTTGVYKVVATLAGCGGTSQLITIKISPPALPVTASNSIDYEGVALIGTACRKMYDWTGPNAFRAITATATTMVTLPNEGDHAFYLGSYNVVITDGNGCTANATTTVVDPTPAEEMCAKKSIDFNGTNVRSGQMLDGGDVIDSGTGSFSLEFWIKPQSFTADLGSVRKVILNKGEDVNDFPGSTGYGVYLRDNQTIEFSISNGFGTQAIVASNALIADSSYHVACIRDAVSNQLKIYVNGFLQNTVSNNAGLNLDNNHPFTIGGYRKTDGNTVAFLNAILDEVRVWKSVRSESDIRGNMHRALSGAEATMTALFAMDETGGRIADHSTDGGATHLTWVTTAGAFTQNLSTFPMGYDGRFVNTIAPSTVGQTNATETLTVTSAISANQAMGTYVCGELNEFVYRNETFPDGIKHRSKVVWGNWTNNSGMVTDLSFSYGAIPLNKPNKVRLLYRRNQLGTWQDVTSQFTLNPSTKIFSTTGRQVFGEFSVAESTLPNGFTAGREELCAGDSMAVAIAPISGATYLWTYSGTGVTFFGTGNAVGVKFAGTATPGTITVTPSIGAAQSFAVTFNNAIETISAGNWNDSNIWNCGRIPKITDNVKLNTGHHVKLNKQETGFWKNINMNANINIKSRTAGYRVGN